MLDTLSEELGLDELGGALGGSQNVDTVIVRLESPSIRVKVVSPDTFIGDVVDWESCIIVARGGFQILIPSLTGRWLSEDTVVQCLGSEPCLVHRDVGEDFHDLSRGLGRG